MSRQWLLILLCVLCACSDPPDPRKTGFVIDKGNVKATYDPNSGRLKRIDADTNHNGKIDTYSYMDGARIERIEIDRDEDGKIDRWEHYKDGRLESVGTSTRGDGVEDEWAYPRPDGTLLRVETDTNRDGKIDKWEEFDPPRAPGGLPILRSVSQDPDHTGHPTLRMLYREDGSFDRTEHLNPSGR